jgi:hypothetical protein
MPETLFARENVFSNVLPIFSVLKIHPTFYISAFWQSPYTVRPVASPVASILATDLCFYV